VLLCCLLAFPADGSAAVVDFEIPPLDPGESNRIIDPYVCPMTGVVFTIEPGCCSHGDEVVGLVKNNTTSVCTPPPDDNQKLASGRAGSVGYSGFPIRATFPEHLPSPAMVSVEYQALAGAIARLTLYDEYGGVIGDASGVVMPIGTCSGGSDRGRVVVTAMSFGNQPIASVAMSLSQPTLVWVIDDFTFVEGGIIAAEPTSWGRVKALYTLE
ncbi:MAG: hypothetical protein JSW50_15770, partial [Candidatus Latescibacterota bacterium]